MNVAFAGAHAVCSDYDCHLGVTLCSGVSTPSDGFCTVCHLAIAQQWLHVCSLVLLQDVYLVTMSAAGCIPGHHVYCGGSHVRPACVATLAVMLAQPAFISCSHGDTFPTARHDLFKGTHGMQVRLWFGWSPPSGWFAVMQRRQPS